MKLGLFDRFSKDHDHAAPAEPEGPTVVQIDATSLSRVFSAPMWLRDLGLLAWFLVGVALLLVGLVWLLGLTSTITVPVVLGAILATVAGPLVTALQRHGVPRAAGAAIVLLGLIAIAVVVALMVFGGIYEQSDQIKASASDALDKVEGWMNDAGAGGTSSTADQVSRSTAETGKALLQGVANGIKELTSLVFFLTFTTFSTFFLLKDGPSVRAFVDRHLGVPHEVATIITGNVTRSLRRYFLGVTYVAAFNAIVVGLAALVLDVPLAGTIAVVVFVTAYVPFIGAFVSGAFAVILTLSAQGTTSALIMLVVVILANGLLQNIVQPIAFGATLDLNPLVVLIVTIGFGAIFGMLGMVLAAPLTSAALHITRDLAEAKAIEAALREPPPQADPAGAAQAAAG
ncbi:AI-2E family transporter [Gaiella sp.]|uniref:AI-2E family transporter n=1 Tax=Gaiella sp. TaxID=2663207 RepID=UPI002B9086FA|nr:AI-2E family transporter [Gaiella sp.]HWO80830.1 AI-2E family transporter [Gaiella sp.]